MKTIFRFFANHLDDLLIFAGAAAMLYATYRLSLIAAIYVLGVFLIGAGVLIGLGQKGSKS